MRVGISLFNIILIAILLASAFSGCSETKIQKEGGGKTPESMPKVIVQLEFSTFPKKYTCDGMDVSPRIKINGVAENAKSIALIMDDPDAPMRTFTHWIIWNIPASKEVVIPEAFPTDVVVEKPLKAVQGVNDFKKIGYGGPCPPPGKPHRYFFRVYVLDRELDLKPGSNRNDLESAMEGGIIQYGEAIAIYGK
jgi:hypothetical protein